MQAPEPLSKRKRGGQALSPEEPTVSLSPLRITKSLRDRMDAEVARARALGVKRPNRSEMIRILLEERMQEAAELYLARRQGG